MQPKDFSKRKFKMIPGADYSDGPISKYGTFGNMLRTRTIAGLKKSADNIPISAADLTGENIEQITDFVNPMAGVTKAISKSVKKPATDLFELLSKDEDIARNVAHYTDDNYQHINKQLLNGETPDNPMMEIFKYKGNTPDQTFRGTRLNREAVENLQEGDLIENRMILSTTLDRGRGEGFVGAQDFRTAPSRPAEGLVDTFITFDNRHVPQYNIADWSHMVEEQEVLIAPNTLMQVSKPLTKFGDGSYGIDLQAVHPEIQDIIAEKGGKVKDTIMSIGGAVGLGSAMSQEDEL